MCRPYLYFLLGKAPDMTLSIISCLRTVDAVPKRCEDKCAFTADTALLSTGARDLDRCFESWAGAGSFPSGVSGPFCHHSSCIRSLHSTFRNKLNTKA